MNLNRGRGCLGAAAAPQSSRACLIARPRPFSAPAASSSSSGRRALVVRAKDDKNWWEKLTGGKEDAARKSFQDQFGGGKKFGQQPAGGSPKQPASSTGGGGLGGMFGGSGGSGGGGGGGGGFGAGDGPEGPEQPIWQEFLALMKGVWVVFWNTAIFMYFAHVLHTSLDWCCQIELLMLVGAPQQAFERLASVFYGHVEAFEKNVLGWDIPQDEDKIPMYENIALYFPEEHAYTFDSYRYNMSEAEKKKLKYFYALRHYERDGGSPSDVVASDVQAIQDKYEPMEADRRAYRAAKASGSLEQYWDEKKDTYKSIVRPNKWL